MRKEDRVYHNDGPEEAGRKYHEAGSVIPLLGVSVALRTNLKHFQVIGQIATVRTIYNMVSAVNLKCLGCSNEWKVEYGSRPRYNIPTNFSCKSCELKQGEGDEDVEEQGPSIDISPEWTPALDIELQDTEKFNNIERLTVKLFGDNTIDVRAGEVVIIQGYRDVIRRNEGSKNSRYVTVFSSEYIDYTTREEVELTQEDIHAIETWKEEVNRQDKKIIDLLVEKFEPTVVGHEFVKRSLLIAAANAGIKNDPNRDPKRLRINVLVAGDPSLAKSTMVKKITKLIPNGRFESAIGSSGIGLTFTVTKEANESYVLRLGAIPLASGSICAINEINQTPLEQQKHYFDFMEEGESTSGKYAIPTRIMGHTTIIGSANPRQGRWADQGTDTVSLDEINLLPQVISRFDIICILKEGAPDEQKDWDYLRKKNQIRKDIKAGIYNGYDEHLKKYLMYARTFNPYAEITDEALSMLDGYWVKMGQIVTDDRGRPRKLESLYRIAIAISKLKLKNQVDVEDAIDTMQHYNVALGRIVPVSQSPKEVARQACMDFLREHYPYRYTFSPDLIDAVCETKRQIRDYVGDDPQIRTNWKLREVHDQLINSEHIELVQEKPTVLKWKRKGDEGPDQNQDQELKAKASKQACDECDVCEGVEEGPKVAENIKNDIQGQGPGASHTSHTSHSPPSEGSEGSEGSDSPYSHLIKTEDMPSTGKTAYSCIEHPDKWYISLKGIEISHFIPFHKTP